MTLTKIYPF